MKASKKREIRKDVHFFESLHRRKSMFPVIKYLIIIIIIIIIIIFGGKVSTTINKWATTTIIIIKNLHKILCKVGFFLHP